MILMPIFVAFLSIYHHKIPMQKYGLLGHPLGHSFSKKFHNDRFLREGIDAVYENYDLADLASFPQIVAEEPDLAGLNVTIPYKQAVIPYLDELDTRAGEIGAVNVIKVTRVDAHRVASRYPGIYLKGYNSDAVGFSESIRPMLTASCAAGAAIRSDCGRALVLGTGGASKAVCYALREMGIVPQYVSRRPAPGVMVYEEVTAAVMERHHVIVNCSPVGMFPHVGEAPAIPYDCLTPRHVCFDLIYNPAETLFMKKAAARGAAVRNGEEMLVGQALEAYRIWTEPEDD